MTASITFNPFVVTNAQGMFNTKSDGLRQGTAFQSPNARYNLRNGILDAAETLPMWGGVGVFMDVPGVAGEPSAALGVKVGRADALTGSKRLQGFSVFDQNYAMVNSPQSPVPLAGTGMSVYSYPLKSGARIAVACDPVLVDLRGLPIASQVSWDYINQRLIPYNAAALTISSGTYDNSTGAIALTMSAPINFGPGDAVVLSGLTGTGAYASLNGTYTALPGTAGTTVNLAAASGLGAATITGGNLNPGGAAGDALPVTVLDVQASNCEVVQYDPVTGFATWNYDGACAVIQL